MSARRGKSKQRLQPQLNKQLEAVGEDKKNELIRKRCLYKKMGDHFITLGNLVFGGVLIGGLFEETDSPMLLNVIGTISCVFLFYLGYHYSNKSFKTI